MTRALFIEEIHCLEAVLLISVVGRPFEEASTGMLAFC